MSRGASSSKPESKEELSLEACLDRLEAIVRTLEQEEIELEEGLRLFEEGVGHLRTARGVLERTELRVEQLLDDDDGGIRLEGPPGDTDE